MKSTKISRIQWIPEIASTDNVHDINKDLEDASTHELVEMLEFARRLRTEGDPVQPIALMVAITKSNPPDLIKRPSLLELALSTWDSGDLPKTQQIFSQYIQLYREDSSIPEILLWHRLVYRVMGANNLALAKFMP